MKIGINNFNYKHGLAKTRFNNIYHSIKNRCNNSKNYDYNKYGGRGIKCLWQSFDEFKNDMHELYLVHVAKFGEKQTTIDRIDNNGNYCKENCRWATYKQQHRNRRDNYFISFRGKTMTLAEWTEKLNMSPGTLWSRIRVSKWSIEKALTTPINK